MDHAKSLFSDPLPTSGGHPENQDRCSQQARYPSWKALRLMLLTLQQVPGLGSCRGVLCPPRYQLGRGSGQGDYKPSHLMLLNYFNICVFLAALGLCRCPWASSSCSTWGLLSSYSTQAVHCGGFSRLGAPALGMCASVVTAHRLSCPVACGIFLDQDRD